MTPELIAMLALFAVKETRTILEAQSQPVETDEQVAARVAQNLQKIMSVLEIIKNEKAQYEVQS